MRILYIRGIFNGLNGGTAVTESLTPVDPGSGTGQITVTSVTETTTYQGIMVTTMNGSPMGATNIFTLPPVSARPSHLIAAAGPGSCPSNSRFTLSLAALTATSGAPMATLSFKDNQTGMAFSTIGGALVTRAIRRGSNVPVRPNGHRPCRYRGQRSHCLPGHRPRAHECRLRLRSVSHPQCGGFQLIGGGSRATPRVG